MREINAKEAIEYLAARIPSGMRLEIGPRPLGREVELTRRGFTRAPEELTEAAAVAWIESGDAC